MGLNSKVKEEIEKYGLAFFESLRSTIIENSTRPDPYSKVLHERNKNTLVDRVERLCREATFDPNISIDSLWKLMYERIFYAGTKAQKATTEIQSVEKFKVFINFRKLTSFEWKFDKNEWKAYRKYWQSQFESNWLKQAVNSDKFEEVNKHYFKNTGESAVKLMTKTGEYSGIKFSAHEAKMEKYITIANYLSKVDQAYPNTPILTHFTGLDYNFEPDKFWGIHKRFSSLVGDVTALHLMMDLGFKTVKPDKVLTYLFARLGWLDSFGSNSDREYINKCYIKKKVWLDVNDKAFLLEKVLSGSYVNPLRQLDIWIVKYGQEPEEDFGITKNLEKEIPIEELYQSIIKKLKS